MKHFLILVALLALVIGCGGGGGGSTTGGPTTQVLTGRILNVETTGPVTPAAVVNTPTGETTTASTSDGFFLLDVPITTASINVLPAGFGTWTFGFSPSPTDLDLGDLWVGPQRVTVTGTVVDIASSAPIANAKVAFAGRNGTTDAAGHFSLAEVAYATSNQTGFWGIEGRVQADGFFATGFTANGKVAVASVVNVGTISVVSSGSNVPPTAPYNVFGVVKKGGVPVVGTVAVFQGGVPVRQVNSASDGRYYIWLPVGNYVLKPTSGGSTGPDVAANLTQSNQILTRNLTIP